MYTYFNMLKEEAAIDPTPYSICELTKELATRAGYYRDNYTFANGSVRERTMYREAFDSVLTAKWLLFYKKLFLSKLHNHPEFGDGAIDIINSTFFITMNCINLDKLVSDDVINRYVNLALAGRIKNFLIEKGSIRRLEEYESGQKLNMRLNKSILNQSLSLDDGSVSDYYVGYDDNPEYLIIDLEEKLADNPFGIRLLDAMLSAGKRVRLSQIDKYLPMEEWEKTEDAKLQIESAYILIKDRLRRGLESGYMYDFSALPDEHVDFTREG